MQDLRAIGATGEVRAGFDSYASRGLALGRVSIVHRDQYRLYTEEGEVRAQAIGALLYHAASPSELPAVGDWVAAQRVGAGEAMIHAVLPRRMTLSRRAAGRPEQEQIMATNIDVILIVCGLDHDFNPRRIERYVTLAQDSGAEAAIVLNKSDVAGNLAARIEEAKRIARGARVLAISARSAPGINELKKLWEQGQTVALLGSSGAGKSTIVNRLLGEERQHVQEVRETDSRGRHTTTFRELVPLAGGGALIDTPGMRELQLWASAETVDEAFDDIAELARGCRFRDCGHGNETDCAVQAALFEGTLDDARWRNYRKLRAEAAFHERKTDAQAALAQKQLWKKIHKQMRHAGRSTRDR